MIGERIKNARLARGLSLEQLAFKLEEQECKLTKAALSKYERGKSSPNALVLRALSSALGVETAFFFREPESNIGWGDFRKTTSLRKKDEYSIKALSEGVVDEYIRLESDLLVEPQATFSRKRRVKVSEVDQVEQIAVTTRERLGLGLCQIESLAWLLESHGVIVVGLELDETSKFDGLSAWVDDVRPLILINLNRSIDRTRYNLSHELGHIVLDCDHLGEKAREELAHRFAAAFLVPEEVARRELGAPHRRSLSLAELGLLKRKYGLSIQAWIRRALDVGVITKHSYESLFREVGMRGWRRQEPAKFAYEGSEEPILLKQYVLRALHEGLIDRRRAQALLPELPKVLEETNESDCSALALRKLSPAERAQRLSVAAEKASADYLADTDLAGFGASEVFDEYP